MSEKDVEDVKKMYEIFLPKFKENVQSKVGLMPVAFLSNNVIAPLDYSSYEEKVRMLDALNEYAAKVKATWAVFASEAWMVTVQADTEEGALAERQKMPQDLKDAPGRKEFFIVILITHGWHEVHGFEILRKDGKVTFGEEANYADDKLFRYRLTYFKQKRDYDKMN